MTEWSGSPDQIKNYPYVKDDIDKKAFNFYLSQFPFNNPPQRPDGFLDEAEQRSWERWRTRAQENGAK